MGTVAILAVCCTPVIAQQQMPPEQAFALFEQATKTITSLDVVMQVRMSWPMKHVVIGTRTIEGQQVPITEWAERLPGEPQKSEQHFYRQVMSPSGQRRIEYFVSAQAANPRAIQVLDGEAMRELEPDLRLGAIKPHKGRILFDAEDYSAFFKTEFGNMPWVKIFRLRPTMTATLEPDGAVLIHSPPTPKTSFQNYGFRVWLDPHHGMLPRKVERYVLDSDAELLWSDAYVNKWHQLPSGAWAPIEVTTTNYNRKDPHKGRAVNVYVAKVDVARSKWNQPIPPATFVLAFPKGTQVTDLIRDVIFTTGDEDSGKNLDRLLADAQNVAPLRQMFEPPAQNRSPLFWWIVALNGVVMIGGLALAFFLRRRARAQ
ncbi:MAG: hypothetical protein K1X71_03265 [Pirellulales bacterium]|nr:hypothetical protein [Pirellulales bacterium]